MWLCYLLYGWWYFYYQIRWAPQVQKCFSVSWCLCNRALLVQKCKQLTRCNKISFINLFKSAIHVSGDRFDHPQEHFLTVYTVFGTINILLVVFWHASLRFTSQNILNYNLSLHCILPKTGYTVKKCSWEWANLSPEIYMTDLKRLTFKRRIKSHLTFAGIIRSPIYYPRFQDKG